MMIRGRQLSTTTLLLAVFVLLVGGCGKEATAPDGTGPPTDQNPDLNAEYGGLSATSEEPAFGDAALAASAGIETPVPDAYEQDLQTLTRESADLVRTYAVTLLWGMLESDPSSTPPDDSLSDGDPVDWSGNLTVNRGGVVLRSTIAFEPEDYVLGPRIDRTTIEWVSHTTTSFDGLRIVVIQPLPAGEDGGLDSLTIVAGTHSWTFLVNNLVDLDFTEAIDEAGNKFSIQAVLIAPAIYSSGFTGGAWRAPESPDSMGTFKGRWVSRDGRVAGYMRGHYGVNHAGRRVLFGKVIDESGSFRALIRGTWDRVGTDHRPGNLHRPEVGWFRAELLNEDRKPIGGLHGRWRTTPGSGDGLYWGTWSLGGPWR